MTRALASTEEVSGAAHLPAEVAAASAVAEVARAGAAVTALRLEGPAASLPERLAALGRELGDFCAEDRVLGDEASRALWRELRDGAAFAAEPATALWRVSVPPAAGAEVLARIRGGLPAPGRHCYDWGGGLLWLSTDPAGDAGAAAIRTAVKAGGGGHATLLRAPAELRRRVPVFEPEPPAVAALSRRIKEQFDPKRILNPGRMTPEI
jgi:glycolate oxidase FAD binding subunit